MAEFQKPIKNLMKSYVDLKMTKKIEKKSFFFKKKISFSKKKNIFQKKSFIPLKQLGNT